MAIEGPFFELWCDCCEDIDDGDHQATMKAAWTQALKRGWRKRRIPWWYRDKGDPMSDMVCPRCIEAGCKFDECFTR